MFLWGCGSDIAKFFEVNLWNVYFNQEIKWWCFRGNCCKNLNNHSYGKSHWPMSHWPYRRHCDKGATVGVLFYVPFRKRTKHLHSVVIRYQSNFEILLQLQRWSQTMVQWESELRTVISVMTQSRCCTGVDTMIWRIGCFFVGSVWRTLNRDLRTVTNTVELGRVRRNKLPNLFG